MQKAEDKQMGSNLEQMGTWYLPDTPEKDPENDAFGHADVADNLLTMIRGAKTERLLIGLLGGFGVGKSTVIELLKRKLQGDKDLTVVRLSAERHEVGGFHRSFVFAFAEELVEVAAIKKETAEEQLLGLEYSTSTAISDFSSSPAARLARRFASIDARRTLWKMLWWVGGAVVLAALMALVIFAAGGDPLALVTSGFASLLVVGATVASSVQSLWQIAKPEKALVSALKPGTLTRSRPRVEAADEFERAFGRLTELVRGRLVIAVDDIDRLSPDEVLAGLNSIRSFQLTCKDAKRPIFIVSADERIIATAIKKSEPGLASTDDESDRSAVAYLNRLFVQRQHVPPHGLSDIQGFAKTLLTRSNHLGITHLGQDIDDVLNILIHDRVTDPRHVVRLLNAFFGDLRLALLRERREGIRSIAKGEVSGHPKTLARMTVLKVDFPRFYESLQADLDLLESIERIVAGTEGEPDVQRLSDAGWAITTEEGQRLAGYVGRTAGWVAGSVDLLPFIYLGQDEIDRDLGSKDARHARSLLANAQVAELRNLLNQSSLERQTAFTRLMRESLSRLPSHELGNAVRTAVAIADQVPAGEFSALADSIAATLPRVNGIVLEYKNLGTLVQAATQEHLRSILFNRMLGPVAGDAKVQLARDLVVLSQRPELASVGGAIRVRDHLRSAIESIGPSGPQEATGAWLGVLESDQHADLAVAAATAVIGEVQRTGSELSEGWFNAALIQFRRIPQNEHSRVLELILPIIKEGLDGSLGEFLSAAAACLQAAEPRVLADLPRALKSGILDDEGEEVGEEVTLKTELSTVDLLTLSTEKAPGYVYGSIPTVRYTADLLAALLRAREDLYASSRVEGLLDLILESKPQELVSIGTELCRLLKEPTPLPAGAARLLESFLMNLDAVDPALHPSLKVAFIDRLQPHHEVAVRDEGLRLMHSAFKTTTGAAWADELVASQLPHLLYNNIEVAESATENLSAVIATSVVSADRAQGVVQQYSGMTMYGHAPASALVARAMCSIPWPDEQSQKQALQLLVAQRGHLDDEGYGVLIDNLARLTPSDLPPELVPGLTSTMRVEATSPNAVRRSNVARLWSLIDPVEAAVISSLSTEAAATATEIFAAHGSVVGRFVTRFADEADSADVDMPRSSSVLQAAYQENSDDYEKQVLHFVRSQLARDSKLFSRTWAMLIDPMPWDSLQNIAQLLSQALHGGEADALSTLSLIGAVSSQPDFDAALAPHVSAAMERWIRSEANTKVSLALAGDLQKGAACRDQILAKFGPYGPRKDDNAKEAYRAVRESLSAE
ncbi:P-loop NTPase fold protein [Pseudarthrobacter sp. NPDC057230]|uniref:P-loop NTPase fold protein n=1 Tax=Pseudarthrobacter sp. NPDC057230 TaxID=3346057 RepID=UPI0036405573